MKKVVTLSNGQRRTLTADVLVKGLAAFSKQHAAAKARAFDAGMKAAQNRSANNAIAEALRQSNRCSAQSNARAIDSLFDAPTAPVIKNASLLDALDDIVPQRAQALDDAIDGIIPAAKQPLSKIIEEL